MSEAQCGIRGCAQRGEQRDPGYAGVMRLDRLDADVPGGGGRNDASEPRKPLAEAGGEHATVGRVPGLNPGESPNRSNEPQRGYEGRLQKLGMVGAANGVPSAVERRVRRQRGEEAKCETTRNLPRGHADLF